MNLLERLVQAVPPLEPFVNRFYPVRERRELRKAIAWLAPRYGLADVPLPKVGRGESDYQTSEREWLERDGDRVASWSYEISLTPDADLQTVGEEAGHYLHALCNQALDVRVHLTPWPATREGALDYLLMRNWEEFIGAYAGTAYALHQGQSVPTFKEWCFNERASFRERASQLAALRQEEAEAAYSDGRTERIEALKKEHSEDEWSLLEHMMGYRVVDEVLPHDRDGRRLAEFARYTADEARAFLDRHAAWRRYWRVVERAYGERIAALVEHHVPGTLDV